MKKEGLFAPTNLLKKMTKILLVKMNEEKRAKNGQTNRFQIEVLEKLAKVEEVTVYEEFINLFQEALVTYPIYSNSTESLKITDHECLLKSYKRA